jgi:hypothetical protein
MSICVLCQLSFAAGDTILEQRLVADTQFCNVCFTEFMIEQGDSNIFYRVKHCLLACSQQGPSVPYLFVSSAELLSE